LTGRIIPSDFMFVLTEEEVDSMVSQFVIPPKIAQTQNIDLIKFDEFNDTIQKLLLKK